MARPMGMPFSGASFKKKNRWRFVIRGMIDMENFQSPVLPPIKSARPSISFKEIAIEHLIETITIPGKPEWSPLEVTLYDLQCNKNPLFTWLKKLYDPQLGIYKYLVAPGDLGFKVHRQIWNYSTGVETLWRRGDTKACGLKKSIGAISK
jgi:hypothetical protein